MTRIADIMKALESWAPRASQQSYDNVGLQVGDAGKNLSKAIIALDLTPAVVEEAIANGAALVITHHPLIFRPLKSVTQQDWHGSLILKLASAGIALYCIHTNLDAAKGGVSFALAEQLGLTDIRFLRPIKDTLVKLVTFVPADHFEVVREALAQAGAGQIGDYDACAFSSTGTGYFRPGASTNPHIGEAGGDLTSVNEIRIETEVLRWYLPTAIRALQASHPYEEVAYDVYPLKQAGTQVGMGAIGMLEKPESLQTFLKRAATALSTDGLRFVGDPDAEVKCVAVCGGSGADLMSDAMHTGADAFLTADITYHRFFDVLDTAGNPRMALIDVMHYETEACTEVLLVKWLAERFPDISWIKTANRTSPIDTFIIK